MTHQSTDVTLEPCPFCGGKPEWNKGQQGDGSDWNYVACSDCEATAPHPCDMTAWQRRATLSKPVGEVMSAAFALEKLTTGRALSQFDLDCIETIKARLAAKAAVPDDDIQKAARDGWFRALVLYVDIFAEEKEEYIDGANRRWPLPASPKPQGGDA